jgi:hypothetical protein
MKTRTIGAGLPDGSGLAVVGFEIAQDLVAALYGAVQGFLGGLLAGQHGFELGVNRIANLG